ncbi:MAG: glutathione transport system permease protein [Solirubrobacteraceae bacterium]|jgi:peptide/nickel transport system permease protein|nr:glutathione transport system permease protein [Solirubrobacteraceae bacterium]
MSVPSDAMATILPADGTGPSPLDETRVPGRWGIVVRRFLRHRLAVVGLGVLVFLFVLAFVGPYMSKWSYTDKDFNAFLQSPSATHWFGTTQTGADVYALTLRGMQKSLIIGLLVALFSTGIAALVGSFAGYFGGWVERVLMWVVDLLLVLPSFLIVAILSPTFRGRTWLIFVVLLAAFLWMVTARIVRGMTISLREREYVMAARYMGVPAHTIIFRHILPNISSLLIIDATINVSAAIISETGLSYFGFGVQPPDVSLGTIIADGTTSAATYPWLFAFAGGLLVIIVLAVNLVGDGLRDAMDPSSRSR